MRYNSLHAGGHLAVVQLVVDQARRMFPLASEREAVLSAKCRTTGLTAEEAAEGERYTDVADYLAFECARLRLLARAVSGVVSWDLVLDLTKTLGTDCNAEQGVGGGIGEPVDVNAKRSAAQQPDWLMVERRLCVPLVPFVPAGRRIQCAFQLLAFAAGTRLRGQGRSVSPLRALCGDLQHTIANLVHRSPRLWI
eukprot:COSAG02_NODE_5968_length_3902_cov_5.539574_3_plen_195_part_00